MIQLFDLKNSTIDSLFDMVDIRCNYMHHALPRDRWQCESHNHPNYELCYIFEGRGTCWIDNVRYDASSGCVFVIPPGVEHYEQADAREPFNIMFLKIDHMGEGTEALHTLFSQSKGLAVCDGAWRPIIHRLFEEIRREICAASPGYLTITSGILRIVYIALFRDKFNEYNASLLTDAMENSDKNMRLFRQVEQFIYSNLNRQINIESLAERFHYHPKYLSLLVKKATGRSLAQHITHVRITRARDYLMYSDVSIERIVDQLGFISINSFYKFFKKQTGMTPGAYRKEAKHNLCQGKMKGAESRPATK